MENYLYSTVLYRILREENSVGSEYVRWYKSEGFQFPVEFKTVCVQNTSCKIYQSLPKRAMRVIDQCKSIISKYVSFVTLRN